MTRSRASTSIGAVAVFIGSSVLSGALAMPIAHADPILVPIQNAVEGLRGGSSCPALNYRGDLEGAAQGYARGGKISANGYPGTVHGYKADGDPTSEATGHLTSTAFNGIMDCKYKDFGVGMLRSGDTSTVTVALGEPTPAAPPPPPPPPVAAPAPVVPPPVAAPEPAKVAPTNAVTMNINISGLGADIAIASSADIPGSCTYRATAPLLPAVNKSFDLAPNGSMSFSTLAPPLLSTYHVVLSCKGVFDGKTVEFGHVEQDVTATG
jgi:hypothetical protein